MRSQAFLGAALILLATLVPTSYSQSTTQSTGGPIGRLEEAVIDLERRLAAAEETIVQLQAELNTVQNNTVLALDDKLSLVGTTALFRGVNVQVVNGLDQTDSINGLGNLIVGYDEQPPPDMRTCLTTAIDTPAGSGDRLPSDRCSAILGEETCSADPKVFGRFLEFEAAELCRGVFGQELCPTTADLGNRESLIVSAKAACVLQQEALANERKAGSHNLVVGSGHTYRGIGGTVLGVNNTIDGLFSNVVGGGENSSLGQASIVSGGAGNTALDEFTSISGGTFNVALTQTGPNSISGGSGNQVGRFAASISGGIGNLVGGSSGRGIGASVSGGYGNDPGGYASSISGGLRNVIAAEDFGDYSQISGGQDNRIDSARSTIVGGENNVSTGTCGSLDDIGGCSILGGRNNHVRSPLSTIVGGENNATDCGALNEIGACSILGGLNETAVVPHGTIPPIP